MMVAGSSQISHSFLIPLGSAIGFIDSVSCMIDMLPAALLLRAACCGFKRPPKQSRLNKQAPLFRLPGLPKRRGCVPGVVLAPFDFRHRGVSEWVARAGFGGLRTALSVV